MTPMPGENVVESGAPGLRKDSTEGWLVRHYQLVVVTVAALIYLLCIVSPPSLMDDVDSVQATISRTMLRTGDWVTPHLDGIKYFEKPPLKYWLIACAFKLFGISDVAARLPMAVITVLLCWLTARMGAWAFDRRTGLLAGLALSTSIGLFLFTRVLISDVALTFTIALAVWAFLRALDEQEKRPQLWGLLYGASVGTGLLFKGLVAALFPLAAGFLYLVFTGKLMQRETWRRLVPVRSGLLALAIAAPWHILATLRNPPYLYFSFQSGPGRYHGFFWFYFFNEHILRFLNKRFPRDYNTVPVALFWAFHLVWFFPWSIYFPALVKLRYRGADRASRARLMALCWIGFVMVFFSFSSTQEYYSMPCYPAIALLLACAIASTNAWISKARHLGDKAFSAICVGAAGAISFLLARVWTLPAPGDISQALAQHPEEYTLSLGHMGDLTLSSFAYLKGPLMLAGGAVLVGLAGVLLLRESRRYLAPVLMMILFFHAARFAMVTFDPYLSSKQLADALRKSPQGELIVDDQYYTFASVFFYADRDALLLNGRVNNLEYGSNAPGAPNVFITDAQLPLLWDQNRRWYLVAERPGFQRIEKLLGEARIFVVRESGGKYLITNKPITENASLKARYFSGRNRDLRRDVTVAHGNGAVGISGRFRIVRNHQNGLSALLIYVL
jgi:4-amino-4-deoxy-L-arabinose transferase-like glycosyltransferase